MGSAKHLIWGKPQDLMGSGARICQTDGVITIEGEDYDREDNRQYQYWVTCTVEEYRRVLQEGGGVIKSSTNSSRVEVSGGKGCSYFTIWGVPSPANTPGGTMFGESRFSMVVDVELEQLLPRE